MYGRLWLPRLGPGFQSREVGHTVFFCAIVELGALAKERRAGPVPACMIIGATQNAPVFVGAGAGRRAVTLGTGPAGVMWLWAAGGHMVPALAFKAVERLPLALLHIDFFLTNEETASQHIVNRLR